MVPKKKRDGSIEYINAMDEKSLQLGQYNLGKYSKEKILSTWLHNIISFEKCLDVIIKDGIRSMRVSSNLFPLCDFEKDLLEDEQISKQLKKIGDKFKSHQMRVTTHPSQFVVLSSLNPNVIKNSIEQLKHHAWIFDKMELDESPYYSINIHGGVRDQKKILCSSIEQLPDNIRKRLTLENDESSYNVKDLFEIYKSTNTPICFDSHHHTFNDASLSGEDAMGLAGLTWGSYTPMTHLSNTEPSMVNGSFKDKRKHSDFVHYIPEYQRIANNNKSIDIDFEFKQKNLAIFEAIKNFEITL